MRIGSQTTTRMPTVHSSDGQKLSRRPATTRMEVGDVPPPGPPMMNRARPPRLKLTARVTMMSGTPVAVTSTPVKAEMTTVMSTTARAMARQAASPWSSIHIADRQLAKTILVPDGKVDAAGDDDHALAHRQERQRHRAGGDRADLEAVELRQEGDLPHEQHDEEHGHADGPALAPGEAGEPDDGRGTTVREPSKETAVTSTTAAVDVWAPSGSPRPSGRPWTRFPQPSTPGRRTQSMALIRPPPDRARGRGRR